jgi:hypothetical protein
MVPNHLAMGESSFSWRSGEHIDIIAKHQVLLLLAGELTSDGAIWLFSSLACLRMLPNSSKKCWEYVAKVEKLLRYLLSYVYAEKDGYVDSSTKLEEAEGLNHR